MAIGSSGNKLPTPWAVTDGSALKSDDSGSGASQRLNMLVKLNESVTLNQSPCPLPYTSTSGHTYCDGDNAVDDSGNTVIVDTFSFLGAHPPCTVPTSGSKTSVTGIWQDNYDYTAHTDTFVLALADCAGIGAGTAYAGTATPSASTDIATLLGNFTNNTQVTVHGVVVAVWSATSSFGFVIQDPAGGPDSGIKVSKGSTSTSTATAPAVGDYVTVVGTAKAEGPVDHAIKL